VKLCGASAKRIGVEIETSNTRSKESGDNSGNGGSRLEGKALTGDAATKAEAVAMAEHAIDRALSEMRAMGVRGRADLRPHFGKQPKARRVC
jgi:hypothetical protein